MTTSFEHLIVVPASPATADRALMDKLARQICTTCPNSHFHLIAMVPMECVEGPTIRVTSDLLAEVILHTRGQLHSSELEIDLGRLSPDASPDQKTKVILVSALGCHPAIQTIPVIVMPAEYAPNAPRIFLTQFLGAEGIRADLNQHFEPGEAGIVNCGNRSRDTLYPNGREAAVLRMMFG